MRPLPEYEPLLIHERFRYEKLLHQFSPSGRTPVRLDNVDQIQEGDVLRYREDHGYAGSFYERGTVIKITDKSLVVLKDGIGSTAGKDKTSRLRKDDSLARRRVYRLGTASELAEYQALNRRVQAEQEHERHAELIRQERERVAATVRHRAKEELFLEMIQDYETREHLSHLEDEIAKEYHDCSACGWPGRKVDEGCLRCSDGF